MFLMNGVQFAKQFVNDYLKKDFPVRLVDYRNGWGASDSTLPTPVKFFTYEPLAMDEWPTIITVGMSMNRMERIGYEGPHPLYRVNYTMRTYVWVRDIGSEEATLMRDRLTTVLRASLLDYPCLKAMDRDDVLRIQIDEGTIQEQYSDLTLLKGDRVLAGSYISYDLAIDEVVERKPISDLDQIDIQVDSIAINETS